MNYFNWINKDSRTFLSRDYLSEGVTPEERLRQIADTAQEILGIQDFSDKLFSYFEKGWISLSTPVWINFGLNKGLPISCFSGQLQDDTADILRGAAEIGMLSKYGGGTAMSFSKLRGRGASISKGGTSNGSVSFAEIFNTLMNIVSQGKARRGNMAGYWSITHPDIMEVLQIKSEGHPIQDLSIGVTIPEGWMQQMIDGDKQKRNVWAKVLQKRSETGYPYILFEDNVAEGRPQVYKDKGMEVNTSNLCTEILEYQSADKTFTCCLASLNLVHFDEWKETDLVETVCYMLDAVLSEFITKAKNIPFLEKAVKFAEEHRSIGLGVLGYHTMLQYRDIPFESMEAKLLNSTIFKFINERSLKASRELAVLYGEPLILRGYGERFTTRLAIAPTTSSSFILGQISPSIEPLHSNYFIKDLAKGKFVYKNPQLKKVLKLIGKDDKEVWDDILKHGGSVQHLPFLSEHQKSVFKTFGEISQLEILQQAAARQKFIDQGQSLNLMVHPSVPVKDINKLMIEAWQMGIKTLYYQRSVNLAQQVTRDLFNCVACEA